MTIKILQWNVWFKENPKNIAKEIVKFKADIVCAQELITDSRGAERVDTAEYIAKKLKYNFFYKKADTWDNRLEKETQGNAVFSRFPIIGSSYAYVQKPKHNPLDASFEGRVYVEVSVQINSRILVVGTTHFSFSPYFKITKQRKKEVDKLLKVIEEKEGNYIFTGDLNSTPSSYTIKSIDRYLRNAGPDYSQSSWTTKPFDYQGFQENNLAWRLDYIFTSKDIKVKSAKIMKTRFSDHLPILAVIEV